MSLPSTVSPIRSSSSCCAPSPAPDWRRMGAGRPWHPQLSLQNSERARCCSPKHTACVSVCQQVLLMSAAGRRRQLGGGLQSCRFTASATESGRTAPQGRSQREGRGRFAVLLLTNPIPAPATWRDPEHRNRLLNLAACDYRDRETLAAKTYW